MTEKELASKCSSLIAEAGTGEDYKKFSNLSGDQDGYELRGRRWYVPRIGWGKVYRIIGKNGVIDSTYADQLADLIEKSVTNGFVGYDTGHKIDVDGVLIDGRNTFLYQLEKAAGNPAAVNTVCETDCSALVYALLKQLTGVTWDGQEAPESHITADSPVSPKVRNFDHYIEWQLTQAPAGTDRDVYDIMVFTIHQAITPDSEGKYNNFYDTWYDIQPENEHLTVSIADSNKKDYLENNHEELIGNTLTNVSLLRRGDIIRTVTPNASGHICIWV